MATYVSNDTAKFVTNYSDRMVNDPAGIIKDLRAAAHGVKYDTIVGRGSSGMLIVPVVARALRKNWLVIRKPEEVNSSHSDQYWMGTLGRRWIFLDDFCSSGNTFRKTRDGVKQAISSAQLYADGGKFDSELVGYFEYEKPERGFIRWNESARPGYGDTFLDDTPGWAKIKEERDREREAAKRRQDAYYERLRKEEEGRRGLTRNAEPNEYGCKIPGCDICAETERSRAAQYATATSFTIESNADKAQRDIAELKELLSPSTRGWTDVGYTTEEPNSSIIVRSI